MCPGAAIVAFEDHYVAVQAYYVLKDATYEDKPVNCIFIPEIHVRDVFILSPSSSGTVHIVAL